MLLYSIASFSCSRLSLSSGARSAPSQLCTPLNPSKGCSVEELCNAEDGCCAQAGGVAAAVMPLGAVACSRSSHSFCAFWNSFSTA